MISNEIVCEPLQDIASRITSIACVLYRQFGAARDDDFYREKILLSLRESGIEFQPGENILPHISALSFFLSEHRILLAVFHRKVPSRSLLREMKTEAGGSGIRSIMVVVLRDWGLSVRKLEIHSESG